MLGTMPTSIVTLAASERLVLIPYGELLPLALDMIRPHEPTPKLLLGPKAYLVAPDPRTAELYTRAVDAATIYPRVDLAVESPLRLPADEAIAHRVRIRIAKARASRLYPAMRASFRRSAHREERHGRLLAHGPALGERAVATWHNEAFDTLTGWGDLDRYRGDPEYPGEVVCRTPPEDDAEPQWLRLPDDERRLLDHGLSDRDREVAATVEDARADLMGLTDWARVLED